MAGYHPLKELAPRDIVSRAIVSETRRTDSEYVWLDMTHIPKVLERFPTIYENCLQRGIDLTRELVPVFPAAHYTMGGVESNTYGETGLPGLYVCGETACTGVHGANRLASNSLLEGIVFGQRIINKVEEILYRRRVDLRELYRHFDSSEVFQPQKKGMEPREVRLKLQETMWENVGILRDEAHLKKAAQTVRDLYDQIERGDDELAYYEAINMLTVARIIIQAALWRNESRGGHFRTDHPQRDDLRWIRHISFVNC